MMSNTHSMMQVMFTILGIVCVLFGLVQAKNTTIEVELGARCGPQDDNVILRCAEGLVCDLPLPIQHKLEFVPGFTLSEQERRELRRCYQYRQNVNDSCDDKYVVCVNGLQCLPLTFNEGICIPPQS